jgi:hypothetical protein
MRHPGSYPEVTMNRLIILLAVALAVGACKTTSSDTSADEDSTSSAAQAPAEQDQSKLPTASPGGMATVGLDGRPVQHGELPGVGGVQVEDPWVPESGDFVLRDVKTGSIWNASGRAIAGPMAGRSLDQLPAFNAFWFAWSAFYTGSEIWNRDIRNAPGALPEGDACLVDCEAIVMGCPSKDCIPALDHDRPNAAMVPAGHADAGYLEDGDFVLGVTIDGEARAYPHNILWWHEIYNDEVAGREYSVTFCPLTGSGIVFDGKASGSQLDFGVSGRLFNSNLVMYDRQTDSWWSQMLGQGVKGPARGAELKRLPVVETTWGRWREMHPDTLVISSDTGHSRNYESYPYGDYRTDDNDTFRPTKPRWQRTYEAKDRVLGLVGASTSRAYAMREMEQFGDKVVVRDEFEGEPIVVVYDADHRMAVPFRATVDGQPLEFVAAQMP